MCSHKKMCSFLHVPTYSFIVVGRPASLRILCEYYSSLDNILRTDYKRNLYQRNFMTANYELN